MSCCETRADDRKIDSSLKGPLGYIFGTAALWLLVGSLIGLIASLQLNLPNLVGGSPCCKGTLAEIIHSTLTYGKAKQAQNAVMTFGWASLAGIGVSIWLMARMTGRACCKPGFLLVGTSLWNLGVLLGVAMILAGAGSGVEGLEFPSNVSTLLLFGFVLLFIGVGMMFKGRAAGPVFAGEWYLVAALFAFPSFFVAAHVLIFCKPLQGVLPAIVQAWYQGGVQALWFAPMAVAALYYLIPTLTGERIHRYSLASIAFWLLVVLGGWTGLRSLVGGPVPAWIATVGVVASVLMVIPVALITLNQQVTLAKAWDKVTENPALWFMVFGGISFMVSVILEAFLGFRNIAAALRFSHFQAANGFVAQYAFFSMVMFGAIYSILPKVTGKEFTCCCHGAIRRHFWVAMVGVILIWGNLALAGIFQGLGINYAKIHFVSTVHIALPFHWMVSASALLLIWGHLIFLKVVVMSLVRSVECEESKGCCS